MSFFVETKSPDFNKANRLYGLVINTEGPSDRESSR
jgi:hypothetical protein